jgi:hypothetical protein
LGWHTCITTLLVSATYLLGKPFFLFTIVLQRLQHRFGKEIGVVLVLLLVFLNSRVEQNPRDTKKVRVYYFSSAVFVLFSFLLGLDTWGIFSISIQKNGYRSSVITLIEEFSLLISLIEGSL